MCIIFANCSSSQLKRKRRCRGKGKVKGEICGRSDALKMCEISQVKLKITTIKQNNNNTRLQVIYFDI